MHSDQINPEMWDRPEVLAVLASRDIAGVYRQLQRIGISQRRIAALTGQSQSEISEILAGRRVVAYDLLVRIADGLGVPRGHLGLAHDDLTAPLSGPQPPTQDPVSGHWVVRLPLLVDSYGAAINLLETVTAPSLMTDAPPEWAPPVVDDSDLAWHRQTQDALVRLRLPNTTAAAALSSWRFERGQRKALTDEMTADRPGIGLPRDRQTLMDGKAIATAPVWLGRLAGSTGVFSARLRFAISDSYVPRPDDEVRTALFHVLMLHDLLIAVYLPEVAGREMPSMGIGQWVRLWPLRPEVEFPPMEVVDPASLSRLLQDHRSWLPLTAVTRFERSTVGRQAVRRN
jgi:transcriptional regulator with XRE-family HTH domain